MGLTGRIANAHRLVFCLDGRQTVGIAGIKRPTDNHRHHVSEGSGVALPEADWPYELGWVYLPVAARGVGISRALVDAALDDLEANVFATSHTTNEPMHRTLKRHRFIETGKPYPSNDRPGVNIQLFLRAVPR